MPLNVAINDFNVEQDKLSSNFCIAYGSEGASLHVYPGSRNNIFHHHSRRRVLVNSCKLKLFPFLPTKSLLTTVVCNM